MFHPCVEIDNAATRCIARGSKSSRFLGDPRLALFLYSVLPANYPRLRANSPLHEVTWRLVMTGNVPTHARNAFRNGSRRHRVTPEDCAPSVSARANHCSDVCRKWCCRNETRIIRKIRARRSLQECMTFSARTRDADTHRDISINAGRITSMARFDRSHNDG